ncbi:MAG: tRNA 2-thiocytidine biosynthesis protein TtcA [Firmicutes bacterium]|nr:tRNA 2-thiocytidine biosynthesis protein TtcA [Bacillota bacterium]
MDSRFPLPRSLNRRIWRAIVEFDLLRPGDRVLVGFSGGKDSAFLLYALRSLQLHNRRVPFTLAAVTLDAGFRPDYPPASMGEFLKDLGVEWHLIRTALAAGLANRKDPCARCAYLRRGAICRLARELGFNRVALAHHHDDAVETFLLSLFYAGKLQTFRPKTELRGGLSLIRPLVYLREAEIRRHLGLLGFDPVPSGCPHEGHTHRRKVKELLHRLCRENRFVYTNLAAAMRIPSASVELWPPMPCREKLQAAYRLFFGGAEGEEE